MRREILMGMCAALCLAAGGAGAEAQALPAAAAAQYDAELARSLGADERGMKSYVLVILKTGPIRVPEGEARSVMFKGHFANIERLARDKKLVFAGPLDGVDGWRGMYVFNTGDIEIAKTWVALDPVITNGEMVGEYHKLYGSAGLMMVTDIHNRVKK